jgi:endonuclease/exonuclease/phosphatase family metal-dependent hydrolase
MARSTLTLLSMLLWLGCADSRTAPLPDGGAPMGDGGAPDPRDGGEPEPCDGLCDEGVCDERSGACVACVMDADCASDALCIEGACVTCGEDGCAELPPEPDPDPDTTPPPPPPPDDEPPATDPGREPTSPEPFRIRFATYNMRTSNLNNSAWGDTHVGWDSNDRARMERVADEIADQELTVVAAQEIRATERNAVLARLSDRHDQRWGFTSARQPNLDDTAVLYSRAVWQLVRETHFIIPLQGDLQDRYQVGVLLRHRETGRVVWFYSVHFAAGGDDGANERAEAARATVRSIREHAIATDRAFVLGGDFNALASSAVGDIFRAAGFMRYARNAVDRPQNDGCKTFNGDAGSAGRQQCPGGAAPHIDHVWTSRPGMEVLVHRVTATERTSRASDHNPLTVVIQRR